MTLKLCRIFSHLPIVAIILFAGRICYKLWLNGQKSIGQYDITALVFAFLLWGLWIVAYLILFKVFGKTTTGIVVKLKATDFDRSFSSAKSVVIEFKTQKGEIRKITSACTLTNANLTGSKLQQKENLQVGDHREIIYDPQDPDIALEKQLVTYSFSRSFLLIGVALMKSSYRDYLHRSRLWR